MKITSFNPLIVSRDVLNVIRVFEALGFEKRHMKMGIDGGKNINVSMKDANGFRVDVATSSRVPQDLTSIRINVDDFDAARDFFIAHGFVNARADQVIETGSSRETELVSPSGFAVTLCQHIKKQEESR